MARRKDESLINNQKKKSRQRVMFAIAFLLTLVCIGTGSYVQEMDMVQVGSVAEKRYVAEADAVDEVATNKLKDAAARDEAFLQAALAKLEAYAKRKFNMVEVVSTSEMRLSAEAAAISVEFAMEGIPQEDTLRFGVEYTNVIDAFAPARSGSLRREDKNHWVAEFEFEPMKKVLPCPGRHTFFLGGRLEGGPAFAGRIVAEVKA